MKNFLFIFTLIMPHSNLASEPINNLVNPGRYEIFNFMLVNVAKKKAEAIAIEDYRLGNYRYLIYGLRRENRSFGGYLEDNYGIEDRRVSYCVVTESEEIAAETYNLTMRKLLKEKYGRDIFKEVENYYQ